jgi:hypothetical protein
MADGLFHDDELSERLVVAWESIATSLEGLNESAKRAGARYWPESRGPREVVVTHVPTEEDKILEQQGRAGESTVKEWLTPPVDDEPEFIGVREREFLEWERQEKELNASAETDGISGPEGPSTEEAEGKA